MIRFKVLNCQYNVACLYLKCINLLKLFFYLSSYSIQQRQPPMGIHPRPPQKPGHQPHSHSMGGRGKWRLPYCAVQESERPVGQKEEQPCDELWETEQGYEVREFICNSILLYSLLMFVMWVRFGVVYVNWLLVVFMRVWLHKPVISIAKGLIFTWCFCNTQLKRKSNRKAVLFTQSDRNRPVIGTIYVGMR